MLIQLGTNRILRLQCLIDRIVDRMLLLMPINRKPVTAVGIESNTATLHLNAQIPEIWVAD